LRHAVLHGEELILADLAVVAADGASGTDGAQIEALVVPKSDPIVVKLNLVSAELVGVINELTIVAKKAAVGAYETVAPVVTEEDNRNEGVLAPGNILLAIELIDIWVKMDVSLPAAVFKVDLGMHGKVDGPEGTLLNVELLGADVGMVAVCHVILIVVGAEDPAAVFLRHNLPQCAWI
jgi:hypothetical protein